MKGVKLQERRRKRQRFQARSAGMRFRRTCFLLAALSCLAPFAGAVPSGGVEARAEQGRIAYVSSWWVPAPEWQAKWWWREGGGSAWVRAGGFQTGPLIVASGGDGWRRWYPGTGLSTGYWGMAFDGGPWGVWTVQRPDTFEAGAQLGASDGRFSVGAGAGRTWSLEPPLPGDVPWSDRVRTGLTWDDGAVLTGAETTALLPASGPRGWLVKAHASLESGSWFAGVRGQDEQLPGADPRWTVSAFTGWEAWSLRWSQVQEREPRYEARWADDARWAGVTWGAEAQAAYNTLGWSVRGGASAGGRWNRAYWTGSWFCAPGRPGLVHTLSASWREASLEAEARWRVENQSLGWFGPNSEMTLTVRKLF